MAKRNADGAVFALGDGNAASTAYASDTFTDLGEVMGFTIGGRAREFTSFRDLQTTLEEYQPHRAATTNDSSITVEDVDGTSFAALDAWFDAATLKWCQFTFPDGSVAYFSAFCGSVGDVEGQIGEKMTQQFTFRPTSKVTWS